jgi:hypothetical protein
MEGIYPLLLLLTSITQGPKLMEFRELDPDNGSIVLDMRNDEDLFNAFINKFSLFLCTEPGPNTVSACVALQNSTGNVHYILASNNRPPEHLRDIGVRAKRLLSFFGDERLCTEGLLYEVLSTVRKRALAYAKKLSRSLHGCEGSPGCIAICEEGVGMGTCS